MLMLCLDRAHGDCMVKLTVRAIHVGKGAPGLFTPGSGIQREFLTCLFL